jgi:hypothetical protein
MTTESAQIELTDEQWQQFCDPKVVRFDLSKPFYKNGYKFATNGAILIMQSHEPLDNGDRSLPKMEDMISKANVPCEATPADCPKCEKCNDTFGDWVNGCFDCDNTGNCIECDGRGETVCSCCGQDADCEECSGSGKCGSCKGSAKGETPYFVKCECNGKSFEWLPGILVDRHYCRLLQSLGDVKVAIPQNFQHPVAFRIGQYAGVVMPMARPN